MFHQVLTQWMPRHLSPLAFVLSHSRVSRLILRALNVRYMTDCSQWDWGKRTKMWRYSVQVGAEARWLSTRENEHFQPSWCILLAATTHGRSAQAWGLPPTDSPISPEPTDAPMKGYDPQVLQKSMNGDVFAGVTTHSPFIKKKSAINFIIYIPAAVI